MNKEELIRNLKYTKEKHKNDFTPTFGTNISLMCDDILNYLEQEQRWIPVSERLPKESGFYLVSTTDCITIMEFCKGWISQNIGSCNWYVKAWQPLPKPYKEESEDK